MHNAHCTMGIREYNCVTCVREGGVENGVSAVVETVGDPKHPTSLEEMCQRDMRRLLRQRRMCCCCVSKSLQRVMADFLSALSALRKGELKDHPTLVQVVSILKSNPCEVLFQWVPGHCGLLGNEGADKVAREAALAGRRDEGMGTLRQRQFPSRLPGSLLRGE